MEQVTGLITGIVFGFLLQKGRVVRFEKQIGALLLKDMTILKFMLSAILVGMVGIFILNGAGAISLSHKSMNLGAVVIGGALFGAGWAVMGFCPGTSVAALGEGRIHAASDCACPADSHCLDAGICALSDYLAPVPGNIGKNIRLEQRLAGCFEHIIGMACLDGAAGSCFLLAHRAGPATQK